MADTVRYHMEEMVPELEDMEKRGYFNKAEIKQIVKKRTDFEYALKRRAPIKADYLRYIDYESKLDQLRKHRRRILGLEGQKRTLADYCFVRRIHFIYERATRKFRGDLGLWMAWAEFCKGTRSSKQMSRVLTKALQLHPGEAGLWAYAAAWEYELNQNPTAARTLMQRGIRMNPGNQALWVEYFKFELLYAERLRARRAVLGIQDGAEGGGAGDGEGDESEEAVRQVLGGAVALVVFRNAVKALPSSVSFRRLFLEALSGFDLPGVPLIRDDIFASIARDFPQHEEAWDLRARRHVPSGEAKDPSTAPEGAPPTEDSPPSTSKPDYAAALRVYNEALKSVPPTRLPRMGELYFSFLLEQIRALQEKGAEMLGGKKAAKAAIQALSKSLEGVARSLVKSGAMTEGLWLAWADFEAESGGAEAVLREATESCPQSAALWRRRVEGAVGAAAASEQSLLQLFQQCLDRAALPEGAATWPMMLASLPSPPADHMGGESDSDSDQDGALGARVFPKLLARIEARFYSAGPQPVRGPVSAAMAEVVGIVEDRLGSDAARALGQRVLAAVASPGLELLQSLAKIEFSRLDQARVQLKSKAVLDLQPARKVLEHGITAYGKVEPVVWLMLSGLEREYAPGGDVSGVVWRARKTLAAKALDEFELALRSTDV